jgi:hypothetical protein
MIETLEVSEARQATGVGTRPSPRRGSGFIRSRRVASSIRRRRRRSILRPWLRAQSTNVVRHAAALRPFRRGEFGTTAAAPTEGHIQAVNALVVRLRTDLLRHANEVTQTAAAASAEPTTRNLQQMLRRKDHAHNWVRGIEKIWDFYFELFGQRQSQYGDWLLSCDRIALDCYQVAYLGIGAAKPVPAPPPFSYMRTGFSPLTFRRGIPLRRLGQQLNPFPLIELPYHRLVNPWTLGAVLHEVSHNLQSDLGISRAVPRRIARSLLGNRLGRQVAATWTRWNRELFADVSGLLMGGPAIVGSLMDIVGRAPAATVAFSSRGSHPTPYIRGFISIELLRRMGFPAEADDYRRLWTRLYPSGEGGGIPASVLATLHRATAVVIDAVCFEPYPELGNRSLAEVMQFGPKEQAMVVEAAGRMAAGTDPGIVPERFLIGAARFALDNRLARPDVITRNFYQELARR